MKRNTKEKKEEFLKSFTQKTACNVSMTCKKIGISRRIFYKWIEDDDAFKQAVEDAQESLVDMAETKLHQNIMEGKESSIFFFLKTKGKNRGYIETIDNRLTTDPFVDAMKTLPDIPSSSHD